MGEGTHRHTLVGFGVLAMVALQRGIGIGGADRGVEAVVSEPIVGYIMRTPRMGNSGILLLTLPESFASSLVGILASSSSKFDHNIRSEDREKPTESADGKRKGGHNEKGSSLQLVWKMLASAFVKITGLIVICCCIRFLVRSRIRAYQALR